MVTFSVPSLLGAAGVPPAHGIRQHRSDPVFGDGALAQQVLDAIDGVFYALELAGYRQVRWWMQISGASGSTGDTTHLTSHHPATLGYTLGWVDWPAEVGFPEPAPNDLVIAIAVRQRTRYEGAGPTFAVPLPTLGGLGPIADGVNESEIIVEADMRADQTLSSLQITVRQTGSFTLLGRQLGSLKVAAPTIAAVFVSDISAAAVNWQYTDSADDQPGLLPMFAEPAWVFGWPWDDDADRRFIAQIGTELYTAMENGSIATDWLLQTELLQTHTTGDLLAVCRNLPAPPAAADELISALKRRLAKVSGWAHHPRGGPFEGAEQLSWGRLLMLAHNLRVIDVLGTSSPSGNPADVAQVEALGVEADITGFYDSTGVNLDTTPMPHYVGCLQINQVGRVAVGWWQTRIAAPFDIDDDGQDEICWVPTLRRVTATLQTDDPAASTWRFTLDGDLDPPGVPTTGTWTFDLSGDPGSLHVHVDGNDDPANHPIDLPQGMPAVWNYIQTSSEPHMADRALESLSDVEAAIARAGHRTPLHGWEAYRMGEAILQLHADLQDWVNIPLVSSKIFHARDSDDRLETEVGRYLHPDSADGQLLVVRQWARKLLMGRRVEIDGRQHSAYTVAVDMARRAPDRTPVLQRLLDIVVDPVAAEQGEFVYDWSVKMAGGSVDVPIPGVPGGGGGMAGWITITKSRDGHQEWVQRYALGFLEGSAGLSGGTGHTKITSGTVTSDADWSQTDFNGPVDMIGGESGAFVFRWGWWGEIVFYGNGSKSPLKGDAGGSNVVLGPYVTVYEVGVATGGMNSAVDVIDLEQINRPEFVPHHVVAGEWMGAEAFFDTDSSVVRSEVVPQLEGMLAEHLRAFSSPHGRLLIEGHASAPGTEEYNLALSQRRAEAVCRALQVMLGDRFRIPEESIELLGLGESGAPGGPDGPDVQMARRVDVFMDADLMIGY